MGGWGGGGASYYTFLGAASGGGNFYNFYIYTGVVQLSRAGLPLTSCWIFSKTVEIAKKEVGVGEVVHPR